MVHILMPPEGERPGIQRFRPACTEHGTGFVRVADGLLVAINAHPSRIAAAARALPPRIIGIPENYFLPEARGAYGTSRPDDTA